MVYLLGLYSASSLSISYLMRLLTTTSVAQHVREMDLRYSSDPSRVGDALRLTLFRSIALMVEMSLISLALGIISLERFRVVLGIRSEALSFSGMRSRIDMTSVNRRRSEVDLDVFSLRYR